MATKPPTPNGGRPLTNLWTDPSENAHHTGTNEAPEIGTSGGLSTHFPW
jgi:hypothetical protein